jgi:hypothetical protein
MEEERSPVLDIVGDETQESGLEASAASSLSEDSSRGGSDDGADVEGEDSGAVDPREAMILRPLPSLWTASGS